jgi:hypothetical protein
MSLKDWERDVLNRQRNIVFPDTNLNEGRFYRNIVYERAVFSLGQKLSFLVVATYFLIVACVALAGLISESISRNKFHIRSPERELSTFLFPLIGTLFWVYLAVRGVFPVKKKRKLRKGYRSRKFEPGEGGRFIQPRGGRISASSFRRKA